MAMTEAADDQITLIPNALYAHYGVVRIAANEEYLVDVCDTNGTKHLPTSVTELLAKPGDQDWVNRMVGIRRTLVTELKNSRAEVERLAIWKRNIGQAIYEKAVEKTWCEEYDEFAREWDLPQRERDFFVTMEVRVMARDEEGALSIVKDHVSIDDYTDGFLSNPEFNAQEV